MRRTSLPRVLTTIAAAFAMFLLPLALTGCETVKGVGRDIENAGEAGQDALDGDG